MSGVRCQGIGCGAMLYLEGVTHCSACRSGVTPGRAAQYSQDGGRLITRGEGRQNPRTPKPAARPTKQDQPDRRKD